MTIARRHERRVIADLLASDPGLYEHHLRQARDAGFVSATEIRFEQMRESLRNDDHPIKICPQEHLQTELAAFKNVLASVSSQYWSLLIAAPGAPDFITCDHAASLAYKQLVFPLDTRRAVMGDRDHRASRPIIVEAAGVAEVNSRMLKLSERQVYSRTPEVALLKDREVLSVDLATTHCLRE
jgi:hypothetical protein